MRIVLPQSLCLLARYLAQQRIDKSRAAGATCQLFDDQSKAFDLELNGLAGELAYCQYFNCFPDLTGEVKSGKAGTDLGDVRHKGKWIDVKTTKRPFGRLFVPCKKAQCPADAYALMIGEMPTFEFMGYATKEDVFRDVNLTMSRGKPVYAMEQWELRSSL